MIVTDVEYIDGVIVLRDGRGNEIHFPFTPSMLLPPPIFSILDVDLPFILHRRAVELFGPLDDLIRVYRRASRITSSLLLLPPTRQFLLKKGITFGHELRRHSVLGLPPASNSDLAMAAILRERYFLNPGITYLENAAYLAKVPISLRSAGEFLRVSVSDVFTVLTQLRVSPDASYDTGDVFLPSSPGKYGETVITYGEALLFDLGDHWRPTHLQYRPSAESPFLQQVLWILRAASRYYSMLPRKFLLSKSSAANTAHNYLIALHSVAKSVAHVLVTTDVLGDVGRRALLLGIRLRHRKPNIYRSLYANVPICSRGLKGLEYFLHVRFSSPTGRLR